MTLQRYRNRTNIIIVILLFLLWLLLFFYYYYYNDMFQIFSFLSVPITGHYWLGRRTRDEVVAGATPFM